jgi:hypothetical protein
MTRIKRTTQTLAIEGLLREGRDPEVAIAQVMGVTRQRVYQIKKRMLKSVIAAGEGLAVRGSDRLRGSKE